MLDVKSEILEARFAKVDAGTNYAMQSFSPKNNVIASSQPVLKY